MLRILTGTALRSGYQAQIDGMAWIDFSLTWPGGQPGGTTYVVLRHAQLLGITRVSNGSAPCVSAAG